MERTAIIFERFTEPLILLVIKGDLSRFDGVTINGCENEKLEEELAGIIYDEYGYLRYDSNKELFISAIKDDSILIRCGIVP